MGLQSYIPIIENQLLQFDRAGARGILKREMRNKVPAGVQQKLARGQGCEDSYRSSRLPSHSL